MTKYLGEQCALHWSKVYRLPVLSLRLFNVYGPRCLIKLEWNSFQLDACPWENGYIESFNGKLRDELLNREIFTTLTEARVLIEQWRREYNQVRPHSSLGYRPPAPESIMLVTLT